MSSDLLGAFGVPEEVDPWGKSNSQQARPRVDPEDEEDDDFGDFEDAQKEYDDLGVENRGKDLLKLYENIPTATRPQFEEHQGWVQSGQATADPLQSGQDDEWGDFAGQEVMFDADQLDQTSEPTPKKLTKKQQTYAPVEKFEFDADDTWDPVDASQAPIVPVRPSTTITASTPAKESMLVSPLAKKKNLEPAPTNIPPPSVLLSVIANMFQLLLVKTKEIVTTDRASADPYKALDEPRICALQAQISIIRASARIIAGRKLRWKRDTMLSQSMKIGPAGQGGMKLSSIDKNETRREEQEVSEAVYIWKKQIGPLRSTIARVNVHLPGEGLTIPEISDTIPIRQGNPSEGAVKALKCCFLCGVNRDERVAKVDIWVEDSFGEWWLEHWGHTDCVNFWEAEKGNLPQR